MADDGGVILRPLLTGMLEVKECLFTGDRDPAPTAVELGLANRTVPPDDLMREALALAHRSRHSPPRPPRHQAGARHAGRTDVARRHGGSADGERATMTGPDHIRIITELASRAGQRAHPTEKN